MMNLAIFNHTALFDYLGTDWKNLEIIYVGGIPHWIGCRLLPLLGPKNITQAIRGSKDNPKMFFPLYRKHRISKITNRCNVYLLREEGIIQVIVKSRHPTCKKLKTLLEKNGFISQ